MVAPTSKSLPSVAIPLPIDAISAFCRKWDVTEFALFGSVLRGDFGPESDVDVMVVFAPNATPTLFTLVDMQDELEATFGRKVDLLTRRGVQDMVNPLRRRAILETAQVVYGR